MVDPEFADPELVDPEFQGAEDSSADDDDTIPWRTIIGSVVVIIVGTGLLMWLFFRILDRQLMGGGK